MDWFPLILAALRWQYPQAAAVVLPLMAVVAAYVVWAYLPQVRQVGRPWAWALPGLRLTAMGVLALSLLRPAVARPRTAAERGPVVVVIDDSLSMGVTDTGRPAGQRVAVAAALGRLPAGARDVAVTTVEAGAADLAGLTDAVARARNEVGYARLAGRDTEAATARLDATVDAVRRAAESLVAQVRDAGSITSPRLERTLAVLATVPAGVDREAWLDRAGDRARTAAVEASAARAEADARLYDDDPAVHDAADAVAGRTRSQLAWAAAFDPRAGLVARLGPDVPVVAYTLGERVAPVADLAAPSPPVELATDLSGGVRTALERLTAPADAEPPRAVVLLSDGRQVSGGPPESVAAAAGGIPVFTVAVASRTASPNVAITDLDVPRFAYPGEPAICRATVRPTAAAGLSTDVTLTVRGEGERPEDMAHSEVRRVTLGDRPTTLAFTWTPTAPGVTRVSIRAAPVPGEATEADNLAEAWTAVVGSPVGVAVTSRGQARSFVPACASLSATPGVRLMPGAMPWAAQVARADVVLMFDVTARSLPPAEWEAVDRLVAERGVGVVIVAGDAGFGPGVSPTSPLGRLLPFAGSTAALAVRSGGPLQPEPDGPALSDDPIDSARRWAAMPTFDRYVPLVPLRSDARPLLSIGGQPVLAERPVGMGRALCLGSDQAWRWRDGPGGPRDADRFWRELVRTAAGDPYAVEAGGVAMDIDPLAPLPGQAIHVRLRLEDAEVPAAPGRVRVLGLGGGVVRKIPFRWRSGGRADVALPGLPAGEYAVESTAGGPRVTVHVRPSTEAELQDLSGDDGFLRRLSDATGGQSFRLDELGALTAALSAPPAEPPRPVELRLWDGPYLYAGVLGLLTAEWALRRRAGLA
jgi:hypothetical protein